MSRGYVYQYKMFERKLLGKRLGTQIYTHARAYIYVAHKIIVEGIRPRFRVFTQDTNAMIHKRRENLSRLFADDGYRLVFHTGRTKWP